MEREGEVVERQLHRNDVILVRGEASFVDANTVQVVGDEALQWIHAKHIVIAVGTVPTPPLGMTNDRPQIITSDKVMNLERLPRTMVVVGAGVIGLEYASMFASSAST